MQVTLFKEKKVKHHKNMASNIEINYHKNTHTDNVKILIIIIIIHIMNVKVLKAAQNNK